MTTNNATPTREQLQADRSVSFWLKSALESAARRDCVDAYYDAKLLAEVLKAEMDKALGR